MLHDPVVAPSFPGQQVLLNEREVLAALEAAEAPLAQRTTAIAAHERKRTGRAAITKDFPRQDIVHDLSAQ